MPDKTNKIVHKLYRSPKTDPDKRITYCGKDGAVTSVWFYVTCKECLKFSPENLQKPKYKTRTQIFKTEKDVDFSKLRSFFGNKKNI